MLQENGEEEGEDTENDKGAWLRLKVERPPARHTDIRVRGRTIARCFAPTAKSESARINSCSMGRELSGFRYLSSLSPESLRFFYEYCGTAERTTNPLTPAGACAKLSKIADACTVNLCVGCTAPSSLPALDVVVGLTMGVQKEEQKEFCLEFPLHCERDGRCDDEDPVIVVSGLVCRNLPSNLVLRSCSLPIYNTLCETSRTL